MTIIPFPGHHWTKCFYKNCHGCDLCEGGLALCTRCGGMEGSLPTDCPGELMSDEVEEAVYKGKTDYIRNRGWVDEPSVNSPAAKK